MSDSSFSDEELRDRIREVKRDEEQVSYERRMLHGRIDVVRSEILARIDRRAGVEQSAEDPLQDLVRRLSDALTHTGQLAMLRRLHGAPRKGESYNRADVVIGRISLEQTPPDPKFEFD